MYVCVYAICGLELFRIPLEKQLLCVVGNEDEIIGISPYTAVRKAGQMKVWKWESDQGRVLSLPGNLDGGDEPELPHQAPALGKLRERPPRSHRLRRSTASCLVVGLELPLGSEASSQEEELDAE